MSSQSHQQQTIQDFGEQWTAFQENEGYYASDDLLADVCGPLLTLDQLSMRQVADIGSGTGRIVRMLLNAGARHVVAVEPSVAVHVLEANLADVRERITILNVPGDELPASADLDFVFSIGVIHHIPEPLPVLKAAFNALKPGGRLLIWVYGREGNGLYLAIVQPLRAITRRLPHRLLVACCWMLWLLLWPYRCLCRVVSLPLARYFREHFNKLSPGQQVLTIYDQLNPNWARYYRESEVRNLLAAAGFSDIRLHARHGYSWSAVGTRPE